MDEARVEALVRDLHSTSKAKKFEALQIIRKERIKEIVPELRALYDRERHLDLQREILKTFADIGGDLAVEGLLDALHSRTPELRLEAVRRIARIRPRSAKQELGRILEGDEWDLIRLVLAAYEPPYATLEDLPVLVSVIQRAPNPTIKYMASRALNAIQGS